MTAETTDVSPDTRFVNQLLGLARRAEDGDSQARASLARLRRSMGTRTLDYAALRDIGTFVPDDAGNRLDTYILLSGLFALHPLGGGRGTLATMLRNLRGTVSGKESLDLRFSALLNSDTEDLPYRLRQVVQMLAGPSIPIDWHQLIRDLMQWGSDSRKVQRRWARDYYTG